MFDDALPMAFHLVEWGERNNDDGKTFLYQSDFRTSETEEKK